MKNSKTKPARPADHAPVCTLRTAMNCLTEVLGMGLRGNGTIPAVYSERIRLAKHAGMAGNGNVQQGASSPRDIITKEAVMNALTVDMALGCSTNTMLHLPAIAHEIGMDFDISFANADQ